MAGLISRWAVPRSSGAPRGRAVRAGDQAPRVLVVGQDEGMTAGVQRIVEVTPGAEPVRAPGGRVEAPAGAGFRDAIMKVLQR